MKLKFKNYWGYLLLAILVVLLLYMLLESRQRTRQIDETLKKTTVVNH